MDSEDPRRGKASASDQRDRRQGDDPTAQAPSWEGTDWGQESRYQLYPCAEIQLYKRGVVSRNRGPAARLPSELRRSSSEAGALGGCHGDCQGVVWGTSRPGDGASPNWQCPAVTDH